MIQRIEEPDVDPRITRDDGYLSQSLGRLAGGGLPPLLPTVVGALVTVSLAVAGFGHLSGTTLLAPVVALLVAGVGVGHRHDGRWDWLVAPILRGTEYLYVVALGYGFAVPGPLVLLLLGALVTLHSGVVDGLRSRECPAPWIGLAALGWDGRMLLLALGGMLGWLPLVWVLLTCYLWTLHGWTAARWLLSSSAVRVPSTNATEA
ncbi:hypothetical protein J4H86_12410 [Spiractinospora alimapuensis]|uniref:DUF5941 domain-containing protein n=1 Tax=Spiractinospora alimapuensis TaxID=2820884 RepID=UPI001F33BBB4|nr:DUF5941 domain-containing protein [Spiractinospora alimapuensis]QVQ54401.1 hypothetical protein J4H86_12410 [Spiractinospora alimapuensis]